MRYWRLINQTGWALCIGSLGHPQIHLASFDGEATALRHSRGDVCWGIWMDRTIPEAWDVVWMDVLCASSWPRAVTGTVNTTELSGAGLCSSWSCCVTLWLCCHCRKPCRCSSSTRPMSTPGTRTGRRLCMWQLPTRQWNVRRSWSPCWAVSMCRTAAGARRCTTPPSTATSRWAPSPTLHCSPGLVSVHTPGLLCLALGWAPMSLTPRVPGTRLLPQLWVPYLEKHGSDGRYLCRARVRVRCACAPGGLDVLSPALGCPWLFAAGLPVKMSGRKERRENWWINFILKKCAALRDPVPLLF